MTAKNSIEQAILPAVAAGELAGAAALVWRDGTVLQTAAVGRRDLLSGLPVERDTIFRIASLTKPVATVAALMLLDEGRFDLDEPITQCAPELAHMRVLRDPNGPLDQTDKAKHPITFRDLLTHRSGLTYGDFHRGPIGRAYADCIASSSPASGPNRCPRFNIGSVVEKAYDAADHVMSAKRQPNSAVARSL